MTSFIPLSYIHLNHGCLTGTHDLRSYAIKKGFQQSEDIVVIDGRGADD